MVLLASEESPNGSKIIYDAAVQDDIDVGGHQIDLCIYLLSIEFVV